VDEKQFHMLSYLGAAWSRGEPPFSDGQVVEWSSAILQQGGVVTWHVPTSPTGLIPQSFLRQLKAIGEAASRVNRKLTSVGEIGTMRGARTFVGEE
jgi:hypothetical protein